MSQNSNNLKNPVSKLSVRAMKARSEPYLNELNEAQRIAVEALEGPVLMLAGAGTGKTKALTARIVHLLNTGSARPNEILAVTFTNKAALEMKNRVASTLGQVVEGMPWLGTFHSVCVKLLRRHAELVDLKNNFTILDADDQLRLLKQLIKAANIDEKRWPARHLASLIDRWKNRGWLPETVPASEATAFDNIGTELYSQYQQRLRDFNAVDFGDTNSASGNVGSGNCASPTRGIFAGGNTPGFCDYHNLVTLGDTVTFATLNYHAQYNGQLSNAHGGL